MVKCECPSDPLPEQAAWDSSDLKCSDLPTKPLSEAGIILVAGATGYIGGLLVPELLARGYRVRAMVRGDPQAYRQRWPDAEVVEADALEPASLDAALRGVETAYYLIHSLMLGRTNFAQADIRAARNFREAAEAQRLKRIIYLGGLGDIRASLSPHLHSRLQVAAELKSAQVPLTILRAAIIIGSGSASYEILANLVKNLRLIFIPPWAHSKCQPIGIRDVIKNLVGVLELPETAGKTFDIGGDDILTYEQMLRVEASLLGRRVLFLPVGFSWPGFYAYVSSFFVPVPAPIIRSLIESGRNEVVCQGPELRTLLPFPYVRFKEALVRALSREEQDKVATRWSDAYPPAHELAIQLAQLPQPPQYQSCYSLLTAKPPEQLFRALCQVGGKQGWFDTNWLWWLRGAIDRLLLGIGTSRGRRSATELRAHDVIDFWRVESFEPHRLLLLRAEMKLPGKAWLEFCVDEIEGSDLRRLTVRASYYANSLFGKLYWYVFLPFHVFIFHDLIKGIEQRAAVEMHR